MSTPREFTYKSAFINIDKHFNLMGRIVCQCTQEYLNNIYFI